MNKSLDRLEIYDPQEFQRVQQLVDNLNRETYKRNEHVDIVGDVDAGGRKPQLILRSPDGRRWTINVSNAGAITAALVV